MLEYKKTVPDSYSNSLEFWRKPEDSLHGTVAIHCLCTKTLRDSVGRGREASVLELTLSFLD